MTLGYILDNLIIDNLDLKTAAEALSNPTNKKIINYLLNRDKISQEPLTDPELTNLATLVSILQILYNSKVGSPITDEEYDILQEMLVSMGESRLSGSHEVNNLVKDNHKYTNLRGTLNKVYYLSLSDKRVNKSQRYLDDWIKSAETRYEKSSGKKIDLSDTKVMLQPKFDGVSAVAEVAEDGKIKWLTRGNTQTNVASDVSHILSGFNDFINESNCGIKYEIMCSEENFKKINQLSMNPYKNSRQIVTATLNSKELDFKSDFITPIPLRIEKNGREEIHPDLISKFGCIICKLSDREIIKKYAEGCRYAVTENNTFRTDGIVITILNEDIQHHIGRENDINHFEVAYKFTHEIAYTTVVGVEFNVSEFGYITPIVVFNDVIMKGNRIRRCSLANRERFEELNLHYGDTIKIHYDIIPVISLDEKCSKVNNGRKIEFIKRCPKCNSELNLSEKEVRCYNSQCSSNLIGRILNYCSTIGIENIGYKTLEILYNEDYLKKGIRSLYKLKNHIENISQLTGFGVVKTKKIIKEIESKRILDDYRFFGSLGIEGFSIKTFRSIFNEIPYSEFMALIEYKNYDELRNRLVSIPGIAEKKCDSLLEYLKQKENYKEIKKLIDELNIQSTYESSSQLKGKIVFSGFRSKELADTLESRRYIVNDNISKDTKYLIVNDLNSSSQKVNFAKKNNIKIIELSEFKNNLDKYL